MEIFQKINLFSFFHLQVESFVSLFQPSPIILRGSTRFDSDFHPLFVFRTMKPGPLVISAGSQFSLAPEPFKFPPINAIRSLSASLWIFSPGRTCVPTGGKERREKKEGRKKGRRREISWLGIVRGCVFYIYIFLSSFFLFNFSLQDQFGSWKLFCFLLIYLIDYIFLCNCDSKIVF